MIRLDRWSLAARFQDGEWVPVEPALSALPPRWAAYSAQTLIDLKLSQAAMLLSTIVDKLANPLMATLTTQPTSGLPDILIFLKNLCLG